MPAIRDKFNIHSKAVVCQDVELKGDITIGANTVIHPKATIFAMPGPIVIGSHCIIEESTIIVNRRKDVLRIGDDNLFEIGCRIECPSIGNSNTFGTKCRLHHTVRVGSHCVISPGTLVVPSPVVAESEGETPSSSEEILPDFTVIFGPDAQQRVWSGQGKAQEIDLRRKHVEYLREMIPKFNRTRRGEGA